MDIKTLLKEEMEDYIDNLIAYLRKQYVGKNIPCYTIWDLSYHVGNKIIIYIIANANGLPKSHFRQSIQYDKYPSHREIGKEICELYNINSVMFYEVTENNTYRYYDTVSLTSN